MEKENTRKNIFRIRLNKSELNALDKWKEFLGLKNRTEVVRRFIHGGIAYNFNYGVSEEYLNQLSRIGNNINQITMIANSRKNITDGELSMIKESLDMVCDITNDFVSDAKTAEYKLSTLMTGDDV